MSETLIKCQWKDPRDFANVQLKKSCIPATEPYNVPLQCASVPSNRKLL